ncbi:hypothetical protein P3G55_12940 [Leptospira sp. 96542]|nr:hypothetical protein [Leptospira sp. 96542]
MKITILILLACLTTISCKNESKTKYYQIVENSDVILYELASETSNQIGRIKKLEVVETIQKEKAEPNWLKVRYKSQIGYLNSKQVKEIFENELDFVIIYLSMWKDQIHLNPKSNLNDYEKLFILAEDDKRIYVSNQTYKGYIETDKIFQNTSFYAKDYYFNIFRKLKYNKTIYLNSAEAFLKYQKPNTVHLVTDKIILTHLSQFFKSTYESDNPPIESFEYVYEYTNSNDEQGFIYQNIALKNINFSKQQISEKLLLNCMYGDHHFLTIKNLIRDGADVNYADPHSGITPLIIALEYNNDRTIQYLLDKGADPNKKDFQGKSFNDYNDGNFSIEDESPI